MDRGSENDLGQTHSKTGFVDDRTEVEKTMASLYSDAHPNMEALQIQLWRQASPTRKMDMLAQLNSSARLPALAGLRSRFPHASEAELRRKLADLLLGEDLARKVYG